MGQEEILEAGKELLTLTESPSQTPTNLEEVEKYEVGAKIKREEMAKIWLTEDFQIIHNMFQ